MRLFLCLILLVSSAVIAQKKIIAYTENGKPYFVKIIAARESLFSLGRNYGIAAKELAAFNKLDINKGLQIDREIKIPLTKTNLLVVPCTVCKKVYYTIQPKDGLYHIAAIFNNMAMPTLKKINNLSTENIAMGEELLVGYLKDTEAPAIAIAAAKPTKQDKPLEKPLPVKEVTNNILPPQKEMIKKAEPIITTIKETNPDTLTKLSSTRANETIKSAFSTQFLGTASYTITGKAAIFKSTSGWNDDKFYVLMNNVSAGAIVKITATATNKVIYAKVLGEMPDIKQNEQLLLRISNAAATILGNGEENMQVVVAY